MSTECVRDVGSGPGKGGINMKKRVSVLQNLGISSGHVSCCSRVGSHQSKIACCEGPEEGATHNAWRDRVRDVSPAPSSSEVSSGDRDQKANNSCCWEGPGAEG